MYAYNVQILYIKRYNCPSDRSRNDHIEKVWIETLSRFNSFYDFRIGDIINIDNNFYIIKERIFNGEANTSTDYKYIASEIILRVIPYSETHVHSCGSDTWREIIPLFPGNE